MPAPSGITNLHNTCFAAVILQLLRTVGIHLELQDTLDQVATRFPCFQNTRQHDAHEWLMHLLDIMYMPGTPSPFEGMWTVQIQCTACTRSHTYREPFCTLFGTSALGGKDISTVQSTCDQCQHIGAYRSAQISQWPQYLFVQIQRSNGTSKLDTAVPSAWGVYTTMLGFVCHRGATARSGHYVAYVQYHNQWFHCDDHRVQPVSTTVVQHHLQEAYIILWKRRR